MRDLKNDLTYRYCQGENSASRGVVGCNQVAAVRLGELAGDRKPKTSAALRPAAGFVCSIKACKNILQRTFGDSAAAVLNCDGYVLTGSF